ncbi:MAG: ribonuclease R [Campylobacteraceae bacterium]|nr:ribonuclease R [Campylobacteraceae bacterium]
MKNFLLSIKKGIKAEDIPLNFQPLINNLVRLKAIKKKNDVYELNPKYRIGKIDIATSGTGFLDTFDDNTKDLLVESRDLLDANSGDIVVAKRIFNKNRSRAKAKVILTLLRAHSYSVVYTKILHHRVVGINISTTLTINIASSQKSLKQLPLGTVLKVDNETNNILEVLGVLDDPKVDEKISLALFEKEENFTPQSEMEARSHGLSVDKSLYPDRLDLTHLPFCTIDPSDAKDFDDAVYFDKEDYTLYVAIADVSEYVYEMGYIDKEAKKRGFSIYFPHKSIPMLPRTLSENICSLKPNVDRLAFVFKITLKPKTLEVKKEELFNAIINSKKRYSYDQIDIFLEENLKDTDSIDKEILKTLLPLFEVTKKLKAIRLKNGFEFRSSEIRMILDKNQNLTATRVEKETPSHRLIEDCMLLANQAASKKIKRGIFRTHEDPSFDKLQNLLDNLAVIGIEVDFSTDIVKMIQQIQKKAEALNIREEVDKLIIKSQKKAKYESLNNGHFGLGFDSYTHFTSPIRRYSDLILHRLLKANLQNDKKRYNFLLKDIEDTCVQISELERQSDKVAWDFMDRKFARWANLHIGEDFKAIITSVGKNIIAKLEDTIEGARLFVLDNNLELFEKIIVKIIEVDILSGKIYVKMVKRDV